MRLARLVTILAVTLSLEAGRSAEPVTGREAYNQGTLKLTDGDLTSAEMLLYSAVIANNDSIQPTALYNLGLARFAIGAEALKDGPDSKAVSRQAVAASTGADQAINEGLTAMQRGEQEALIRAYLRGRGARRQLKDAMKSLQSALDLYGDVLARWRRASGDFHSTVELTPKDADAAHNAEVVDRHIAKLVDSLQQMAMMQEGMSAKLDALGDLLEELKGMVPDQIGDPGPGEDGEEDWPQGPEPGMEEGRGRDGTEVPISPEDAARLLEAFQLDRDRTLPMGFEETANPDEKKAGKNW